jgi:hypothetical protein
VASPDRTTVFVLPQDLGEPPKGVDRFERNNLRQLYSALAGGPEKVRLIALWNGEKGDGPGGTAHMVETVRKHAGRAYVLDTKRLWGPTGDKR